MAPGDALTLLVDGVPVDARPLAFNREVVAVTLPVRWTAHGDRWRLHAGPPNRIILPFITRAARVK